jgi:hypothetical protein
MPDILVLEWTFEPPDLFEEQAALRVDGLALVIAPGRAYCETNVDNWPADDGAALRMEMHQKLDIAFMTALALSHVPYTLTESSITRIKEDGSLVKFAALKGAAIGFTGGKDIVSREVCKTLQIVDLSRGAKFLAPTSTIDAPFIEKRCEPW